MLIARSGRADRREARPPQTRSHVTHKLLVRAETHASSRKFEPSPDSQLVPFQVMPLLYVCLLHSS